MNDPEFNTNDIPLSHAIGYALVGLAFWLAVNYLGPYIIAFLSFCGV